MNFLNNTEILNLSSGRFGGVVISSSSGQVTGKFGLIQVIENCKFQVLSGSISGNISSVTCPAGILLAGEFTTIQLSTGSVIAYNIKPFVSS
jgi:hypothetical protein